MKAKLVWEVRGVPELVWQARKAMADALREHAATEVSGYTAARLLEIAAAFEAGQKA